MGAGVSVVTQEDIRLLPQYALLGGDSKYEELKAGDDTLDLTEIEDPYLKYGGEYSSDKKNTKDFKYITFREYPAFFNHKSMMAAVLSPDLFAELKDIVTEKGYTLSNAIMTGVVNPNLLVGCTAGCEDSWEKFKDLFYPIVKKLHGGYDANTQKHPTDLNPENIRFSDTELETFNEYVVSTKIRAVRNFSNFALPAGAKGEDRTQPEFIMRQVFTSWEGTELSGKYYSMETLSKADKSFLSSRGFLFNKPSAKSVLTGSGCCRSWPLNRGVFHNEDHTALIWVNEEDHVRMISMEIGGNVLSVFRRFCEISNSILTIAEKNLTKYMHNEILGFLGTCPSNVGTGLKITLQLKLQGMAKLIEDNVQPGFDMIHKVCKKYGLTATSATNDNTVFNVSNNQKIGISEVALVQLMINGVGKLIEVEKRIISGLDIGTIEGAYELEDDKDCEEVMVVNIKGEISGVSDDDDLVTQEQDPPQEATE